MQERIKAEADMSATKSMERRHDAASLERKFNCIIIQKRKCGESNKL